MEAAEREAKQRQVDELRQQLADLVDELERDDELVAAQLRDMEEGASSAGSPTPSEPRTDDEDEEDEEDAEDSDAEGGAGSDDEDEDDDPPRLRGGNGFGGAGRFSGPPLNPASVRFTGAPNAGFAAGLAVVQAHPGQGAAGGALALHPAIDYDTLHCPPRQQTWDDADCDCISGELGLGCVVEDGGELHSFLEAEMTWASNNDDIGRDPNNLQRKRCYRRCAVRLPSPAGLGLCV